MLLGKKGGDSMRRRHILNFFDDLVQTSVFVFLCSIFLVGALAGGLTGLMASEGDAASALVVMMNQLPQQILRSLLGALLWVLLPAVLSFFKPPALFLSALCAAKGFTLALTIGIVIGSEQSLWLSILVTGLPAVLSVPAVLSCCTMMWGAADGGRSRGYLKKIAMPYVLCIMLVVLSALLRLFFAALLG